MNKAQFIAVLMPHFNDSKKDATHAVDIVFDSVTRAVSKGDEVNIAGFGKFKKVHKKARTARNPFTGDPVKVKAKSVPRFVAGKELKEIINGDRKQDAAPKPEGPARRARGTGNAGYRSGAAGRNAERGRVCQSGA